MIIAKSLPFIVAALGVATPLWAQDSNCVPGAKWVYTGTAKGSASIHDTGKATVIEFTPAGANKPDSVVFSSVNPATSGTYQVNADIDVKHLSDDAAFELEGATSAAAGRPFEVVMAAGDGGSSGLSRPINTTDKPFTVLLKTQASAAISVKVRNFVVCKLR